MAVAGVGTGGGTLPLSAWVGVSMSLRGGEGGGRTDSGGIWKISHDSSCSALNTRVL